MIRKTKNTFLVTKMMTMELHITFSKMSAYVKSYDCVITRMSFFIKEGNLLKKINGISNKVITVLKKKLVVKKKKIFLNTQIRSYGDKATDSPPKNIPEAGSD